MHKFGKTIPFDPGFSNISFSFIENIQVANQEFNKLKANHQKKFWLTKFEPLIIDFINNNAAFYLGCILWGAFIYYRFKENPKEISGNATKELNEKELQELDCAKEVKATIEYMKIFDRDCKYFLNRSANIPQLTKEILENYIEFAQLNDNFKNTFKTNDVKLPKAVEHFEHLSIEQLDELYKEIYNAINSNKIETLLKIGFYRI